MNGLDEFLEAQANERCDFSDRTDADYNEPPQYDLEMDMD